MNKFFSTTILACLFICSSVHAQDDSLMKMLSDSMASNRKPMAITGTFKAVHIINMQTVESPAKGALNFIIQHRFGKLNDGAYNFFGLDNATLRLGFDYGITDRLAVGIGRSSLDKTFDAYGKYKLLLQKDDGGFPLTIDLLSGITNYTLQFTDKPYLDATYRTAYYSQLLIARKVSSSLSLQLAPTWIHYNLVPTTNDKNDVYALGGGARFKITKRMSIDAEYNYVPGGQLVSQVRHNSLSLGIDIETGGHVFQLIFTNSQAMTEPQYIGQTPGNWSAGDIFFGFNISRIFNVTNHAKKMKQPA